MAVRWPACRYAGLSGWHEAVREGHTKRPMKAGRFPIVTVTGDQAAETSDPITEGSGGRASVERNEEGDAMAARQNNPCSRAGNQAAEPRKSITAKELAPGIGEQLSRSFEDVIQPGADDAADTGNGDEKLGEIGFGSFGEATACEIGAQDKVSKDHSGGDHKAVRWDGERSEMEKRNHLSMQGNSLAGCAAHLSEKSRRQIRPRVRPVIGLIRNSGTILAARAPYFLQSDKMSRGTRSRTT